VRRFELVFELVEDVEVVMEGMEGSLATATGDEAAHWTSCVGAGSVAMSRRTAMSRLVAVDISCWARLAVSLAFFSCQAWSCLSFVGTC